MGGCRFCYFRIVARRAYPRRTYLPPPGRPRWQPDDPAAWDLVYLSWGRRWFGEHPIPPAMHDGWAYCAVVEGAPRLEINGRGRRTRCGEVFVFHPDCAYGWRDAPGACCRTLSWLWRSAPAHSLLEPPPGGFRRVALDPARFASLRALHARCVRAVAAPGELSKLHLRKERLELDILLASARRDAEPADTRYRFNLAVQFLRHNPAELEPVKRLCEYLQVSPATLKTLFHRRAGASPRAFALAERMRLARDRLTSGRRSVKEVAYSLGYRHPNDFSRAFMRHFGMPARDCGRTGPPRPATGKPRP